MTGPLDGVRIADFSWVGAGPRATKDMADYGATVIKIESRKRLDLGRLSPPFKNGKPNPDGSMFFGMTNTSKKGVTINLGDPKGVEVAKKLVAWADIVVENFGKGYLDRIGLSFETLQAINPKLIQVSVSVAGRTGPMSGLRGYGNSAAALSGLAALSGWPDRPPHMPPFAYGDVVAPMFATVAMLAALEHRRVTGRGQLIDVSQVEPLVHVLADQFAEYQVKGDGFTRPANRSAGMAPHGVFPCRGVDQWCAIAVRDETDWQSLRGLMNLQDDPRFGTLAARKANEDALDARLSLWTAGQDKHLLADRLTAAGIPAEAVFDGRDVFTDPELIAAGHYVPVEHAVLGACDMPGPPVTFSEAEVTVGPPPLLGQDNHAIFVELLGMDEGDVRSLIAGGALA
jgi:benzylsuccinate CoA-transferase BbsF subunit